MRAAWVLAWAAGASLGAEPGRERTWALLPIALVNPENGYGGGCKYLDRAFTAGSSIDLQFYYTAKHQASLELEGRRWWTDWEARTLAEFFYYPESWFGGGNHPRDEDEHIYTPRGVRFGPEVRHSLGGGWQAKASADLRWSEMEPPETADGSPADPEILGPDLSGYSGGFDDLWMLGAEFDTRDDDRLPSRGWHAGHSAGHSLAGEFAYGAAETWVAAHAAPHADWELAAKAFQRTLAGDAPFYARPYLGDKRLLRGIPKKRLRDRSVQALQAEIRWQFDLRLPLIGPFFGDRWQVAAFGGAGRAGGDFAAASRESLHWAGGVGGRLIIGKRLGALRGDLGFSGFGYGLYIDFNQAI